MKELRDETEGRKWRKMKGLWSGGKERVGVKDELASRVNERWAGKTKHIFTCTIYLFNSKKPANHVTDV